MNATIVTTDNRNVGTNWKEAAAAHFASALVTTRIRDLDEKADTLNSSHLVGAAYPCWQLLGANTTTEPSASTTPVGPGPDGGGGRSGSLPAADQKTTLPWPGAGHEQHPRLHRAPRGPPPRQPLTPEDGRALPETPASCRPSRRRPPSAT